MEWLIAHDLEPIADVKRLIADFVTNVVPPESSGEIFRVAERFGLVGAAGEAATWAGVTGWEPDSAMRAARWCFRRWLSSRSKGSSDLDKAIAQIRTFLLANGSRFEDLDGPGAGRTVYERVGFRRTVGEDTEYLIPSEIFKSTLCKGYAVKQVAQELANRGYLRRDGDRLQVQQRVPGVSKPMRMYAIQSSILTDEPILAEPEEMAL